MAKSKRPRVADEILAGAREALAWTRGEKPEGVRARTVTVPDVDVRLIRDSMKLSQNEFAARFGFAPASVRNWEQGRREPELPARILLAVIERHPEAVEDVLHRKDHAPLVRG
ncbi:MAG: helix-turn-helix domain-containing protein [Bryobacteraceae bacterium]|jgi:putative transcriptional regulator